MEPGILDVLLEEFLVDLLDLGHSFLQEGPLHLFLLFLALVLQEFGVVLNVVVDHKGRERKIVVLLDFIPHHAKHIKSRKNWVAEVHVVRKGELRVVPPFVRVCCSNHCAPRLQVGHNSRLRNRNALLFHCFVDAGPVAVVHLIKLIDQTNALVSQNQSAAFEHPFLRPEVAMH